MKKARLALIATALLAAAGWATPAAAHCDTLDGPVVGAAKNALATGKVEHALIWVQKNDERAVRDAFAQARAARTSGGAAAQRAETAFYGTLVRVHRQGEGAPFTGLKPAGSIEPPIAAADRSIDRGNLAEVETMVLEQTQSGLRQRFEAVAHTRSFEPSDVAAGRAHVHAYVDYVHHVERLMDAAQAKTGTHAKPRAAAHTSGPAAPAKHAH